MADRVSDEHQVCLNGTIFPIEGFVKEFSVSRFPAKVLTGDYDYANEQILSNWIMSDPRGGLLVEEMDEKIHANRYWWSTAETRFNKNLTLPKLATAITTPTLVTGMALVDGGFEAWDDANTLTSWNKDQIGANITLAREDTTIDTGTYSAKFTSDNDGASGYIDQQVATWSATAQSQVIYARVKIYPSHTLQGNYITIDDGVGTTTSSETPGATAWSYLTVSRTLNAAATKLEIRCGCSSLDNGETCYWDRCEVAIPTTGNANIFVDFNSKQYVAIGNTLNKMNGGNTAYTIVRSFAYTITDLVVSTDGYLLIYLGDTGYYWSMTTGEVFLITDETLANLGLRWDAKTYKMAVDGRWWYDVAPGVASPGFTVGDANGGLDDYSLTPKSLTVYRDADGNLAPYCATTNGLWIYSADDTKWVETEVTLPEHDQAGLGLVEWHGALYVSSGLSVTKYIAAGTATISEVGLNLDDGLPQLRSGEIVKFIKGYDEYFALIDSTYEGATSRSQVVSYDGTGWRTWWEASADNKNMYAGIVTSVNKHQLLFSTTDGIYSMALERTGNNPKKVAGYTYAAAAVHISSRFDAGSKVFQKLATKLTLFLDDCTANETVTVSYKIDQSQDIFTSPGGWSVLVGSQGSGGVDLMGAQTSDGAKVGYFSTDGEGRLFYDIMFRIALARGGTSTKSPNVKGVTLSYLKSVMGDRKRAWSFTINFSGSSESEKNLYDAIETILATNTLMPFTFRNGSASSDTHYVLLHPFTGFTPTGPWWDARYQVTVVEV